MERTDFDFDPVKDKLPKSITWIIIVIAIAMTIFLTTFLV